MPATNPLAILADAVHNGSNPESLEKLMDLAERWEKSQAEKAFNAAMHACQSVMPRVARDAKNLQTNSTYALLETVQEKCRPVYSEHGFSLCYGEADCPVAEFKRTVCDVSHVGGHTRRYHLDLPIDGIGPKGNVIGGMNRVQGCISTTSYGQRRLLCMIFNITIGGEDDDGQAASGSELVTRSQSQQLADLIKTKGRSLERICEWADVSSLDELTVAKYREALGMLAKK